MSTGSTATGLAPARRRWSGLWDSGTVAVAADNPAVEAYPFDPAGPSLHADLLALLGIPLGEVWYLAARCAADGRYTVLLVAAHSTSPAAPAHPPTQSL